MKLLQTKKQIEEQDWNSDYVILPVLENNFEHPTNNKISLIYIYMLETQQEYLIPIDHSEIECELLLEDLNVIDSEFKKYTINKKKLLHILNLKNIKDINLLSGKCISLSDYYTPSHTFFESKFKYFNKCNLIIPIYKHFEMCTLARRDIENIIIKYEETEEFEFYNDVCSEVFFKIESSGLRVNSKLAEMFYGNNIKKYIKNKKLYSDYNLSTVTGRPSNSFGNVNFAAINKKDGTRRMFKSRFNTGLLIEFDYSAFHLALIADLVGYEFPTTIPIHEYLTSLYFNTKKPNELQMEEGKEMSFKLLYGGSLKQYEHIDFFKQVENFIDSLWMDYHNNGMVLPIVNRKIPNIENKRTLFNYFIQNIETKQNTYTMQKILGYLENKKSKLILYTYDSFLIDYSLEDDKSIIQELSSIITQNGKFIIHTSVGNTYGTMKEILSKKKDF